MNISPINFTAKISRNWDGVYSQDTKQVIAEYDKSIQAIQTKREEFLELDRFMKSKEIKPYLQNLPAKDKINIVTNDNEEENQSESKTKLEYLAMSDSSIYKIFSTKKPRKFF